MRAPSTTNTCFISIVGTNSGREPVQSYKPIVHLLHAGLVDRKNLSTFCPQKQTKIPLVQSPHRKKKVQSRLQVVAIRQATTNQENYVYFAVRRKMGAELLKN